MLVGRALSASPLLPVERDRWPHRIDLGGGHFALVDASDFEFVSQWEWSWGASSHGGRIYARRGRRINGKHQNVLMHRYLMFAPRQFVVDHRNGDTLDNRKQNLQICTQAQNATAQRFKKTASGYRGVKVSGDKFKVYIVADNTTYFGGSFSDPMLAARCYDAMALKLKGDFAVLNFPGEAR